MNNLLTNYVFGIDIYMYTCILSVRKVYITISDRENG